jgi:TonB family protein
VNVRASPKFRDYRARTARVNRLTAWHHGCLVTGMTCRVDSGGADSVLLRLGRPSPRLPGGGRRASWAVSVAIHALAIGFAASMAAPPTTITPAARLDVSTTRLTWISTRAIPLSGSTRQTGGGGGGDTRPARLGPAPSQDTGRPPPIEPLLRAQPLTMFDADVPVVAAARPSPVSAQLTGSYDGRGEGTGGGFGTGDGTGVGAGEGAGVGPGSGGGPGGGVYRPGGGVTAPIILTQVLPRYPEDAVRDRAQGSVTLQLIVRRDGMPDAVSVIRPIDRGPLDREAERTVRLWRFRPGTRNGVPVDVLVTVIVDFVLY